MGKWISGLLYLFTGGAFGLGVLYDFWTLNDQISMEWKTEKSGDAHSTEGKPPRNGAVTTSC